MKKTVSDSDFPNPVAVDRRVPPTVLIAVALFMALMGLYWQTAWSMVEIWWRSETFAHGFLILPIALYLVWTKRGELSQQTANINLYGLMLLMVCGAFWFVSNLVDIAVIQQLMFTAMIPTVVLTMFGWSITRIILFPLCFLFFMVPFGERLIPSLIEFTAFFTIRSIQLTGIPIYWEGNHLSLPTGNWSVVEACSGIRYLIASIALGSLYCYISFQSQLKRATFFSLFVIVPIIANGLRAFMIVMIGHFSSMKLATGVDHIIYGWVFFGVVMFILFYICSFWADPEPTTEKVKDADGEARPEASNEASKGVHADESGVQSNSTASPTSNLGSALRFSRVVAPIAFALVGVWPLMAYQDQSTADGNIVTKLSELPTELGSWRLENQPLTDWQPIYTGASVELRAVYRKGNQRVGVFLEHYPQQHQDAELINSQNVLVEERSNWKQVEDSIFEVPGVDGLEQVKQARLKSNTTNLIVWSWYHLAGKNTVNDYLGKLYGAYGKIVRGDESATGVILYMKYDDTVEQPQRTLSEVSGLLVPWLTANGIHE